MLYLVSLTSQKRILSLPQLYRYLYRALSSSRGTLRIATPIDSLYVGRYHPYRIPIGESSLNPESTALVQGTLGLLILKSPVAGELHGLGISRRIQQITGSTFIVKPGSPFPALHRMEEEGWISAFWGDSENNRRAKYYRLTKAGQKQLEEETKRWGRISWAIAQALEAS